MTIEAEAAAAAAEFVQPPRTLGGAIAERWRGVRAGDVGGLPIIFALILIAIFFQTKNSHFDDPGNIVNLIVQMAGITTIGLGVVFVLLLGEIDLSVGYVSGVCGVIAAKLVEPAGTASGWPVHTNGLVAIVIALLAGAAIGFLQGTVIVKLGIPSFVVTLAGFLGWAGVVLIVIGNGGTIVIQDGTINGIANDYFSHQTAIILLILIVVGFAATQIAHLVTRRRAHLSTDSPVLVALKILAVAGVGWFVVHYTYLPGANGLPYVALLLALLVAGLSYLATRTRFGRHIYAVGGNAEASRRAGISTDRMRVAGFMIGTTLAALGGIILASRLQSVDTEAGGSSLLLDSIAAAVIGGASLFGGRGHPKNALYGALVIAALANGMGLLGYSAGIQQVATAVILLLAVAVDALARKKLAASGG